jgi:hypothetical protein
MSAIRLRFVTCSDHVSQMIRLRSGLSMPFTPSHVECVTPEGLYLGQHFSGGMQARPAGYDAGTMLQDRIVELPARADQVEAFYAFVNSKIGQPYDWKSIISFVAPLNFHLAEHAICSAIMTLALRAPGVAWFPYPLTVPAHQISPRDLFLMLSAIVEIPH